MALYNFQPRFVPMILSGAKRHTIRALRKTPTVPGEMLHLYTGLRHKGAQLLMRTPCTKVQRIWIDPFGYLLIDGHNLNTDESELLAKADGFGSFAEMRRFWDGHLPFVGDLVHWKFPPEVTA